jgi:hypothetical protein
MKNELTAIRNRIRQIKQELSELGSMRPGSVCSQYRDKDNKRGQYFQLSYSYRGKSRTKHVRLDEVSEVVEQTSRYKYFKSLIGEWTDLCIRECELLQEQKRSFKEE